MAGSSEGVRPGEATCSAGSGKEQRESQEGQANGVRGSGEPLVSRVRRD